MTETVVTKRGKTSFRGTNNWEFWNVRSIKREKGRGHIKKRQNKKEKVPKKRRRKHV